MPSFIVTLFMLTGNFFYKNTLTGNYSVVVEEYLALFLENDLNDVVKLEIWNEQKNLYVKWKNRASMPLLTCTIR